MSAAGGAGTANASCAQCGAEFRCGMSGGDAECWCASLPPLADLPARSGELAASCLCPRCLRDRLAPAAAAPQESGR